MPPVNCDKLIADRLPVGAVTSAVHAKAGAEAVRVLPRDHEPAPSVHRHGGERLTVRGCRVHAELTVERLTGRCVAFRVDIIA